MPIWNPWHGCKKISAGCLNCYVYRRDESIAKKYSGVKENTLFGEVEKEFIPSDRVYKTKSFYAPILKNKNGDFKLKTDDIVYTCFTSDFFIEEADKWRKEAWTMINTRADLKFLIITKRIHRFLDCIPENWGDGYDNVTICSTVENQDRTDYRLPIFNKLPIKHKMIICEPLLENIDLSPYLTNIEKVVVGGESGPNARVCNYDWVLNIRDACIKQKVSFYFKQTGANFFKDGVYYNIERSRQHILAKKANINLEF